tara:strand:+ start:3495 stop:3899 length:405 start_codon:yes stop_codon:yes gene_type:complete
MNTLTEYRFYATYNSGWFKTSIAYVGIDREAIEAKRAEIEAESKTNEDITNIGDITENTSRGLLWQDWTSNTAGNDFIQGKAIKVGECHTDSRCTGQKSFYTLPEYAEEAKKEMDSKRKGQERAADAYYSQQWV